MQPMSSMQTTLLPGVTPGWNDPPPLGNPGSGSRLNRYRRVVDPSLSAAGGVPTPYAASPQQGMPMGVPHGMQPMQQVPYQQHHQQQQYVQPDYSMPKPGGHGDMPQQQGFPPMQQVQQQPPLQQMPPQMQPQQNPAATSASPGPYPMSPYNSQHHHQQLHQQAHANVMTINYPGQYDQMNAATAAATAQMEKEQRDREEAQRHAEFYSTQPATHSSPIQNNLPTAGPMGYAFIPPNSVPGEVTGPAGGVIYVDRATYVAPTKAPGDVSLPPEGLRAFIIKAAMSLHDQKAQGVQLKMHGLMGDIGRLTKDDPFIKKFNYVVDSIDRNILSEASQYLDQLVTDFPSHTRNPDNATLEKPWVGGIRFLLQELNKLTLG